MTTKAKRHVVIDVEAVHDVAIPAKAGSDDDERRFGPPVAWQVVSIGCFSFEDYKPELFGCLQGQTERDKIVAYATYLERDRPCVVTWNGRFFDNPVIGHRAMRFGVPMPWWYASARGPRYRYGDSALDLKDALADFGATVTSDMNQVARLIGWPGKGEVTGASVAAMYAAGEHTAIDLYCLSDVAHEAAIWLRYELLRGNIKPKEWPRVANALLCFLEKNGATKELVAAVDRRIFIGPEAEQLTFERTPQ